MKFISFLLVALAFAIGIVAPAVASASDPPAVAAYDEPFDESTTGSINSAPAYTNDGPGDSINALYNDEKISAKDVTARHATDSTTVSTRTEATSVLTYSPRSPGLWTGWPATHSPLIFGSIVHYTRL